MHYGAFLPICIPSEKPWSKPQTYFFTEVSAALKTCLTTPNLNRNLNWSTEQLFQLLQQKMEAIVQGVAELSDSFMLLEHVSVRKRAWEEKPVNHQSTDRPVALGVFLWDWILVCILPCQTGSSVKGFLTCISLFLCVLPGVCMVACQCTHAVYAGVCVCVSADACRVC